MVSAKDEKTRRHMTGRRPWEPDRPRGFGNILLLSFFLGSS